MAKLDNFSNFMLNNQAAMVPDSNQNATGETYRIWACDNQIYGPVDWNTLAEWAAEGRVTKETWVYLENTNEWRLARNMETLSGLLPAGETTMFIRRHETTELGIESGELRQFGILSSLSNHELGQLIRLGELVHAQKDETIIKRGDPGDALYFVLAGSVRVRVLFFSAGRRCSSSQPWRAA